MFTNRKPSAVLFAFAVAVAATAACADTTAPAPVMPLELKTLKLDTAELCPYGWIVANGVIVCDDDGG